MEILLAHVVFISVALMMGIGLLQSIFVAIHAPKAMVGNTYLYVALFNSALFLAYLWALNIGVK